MRWPRSATAGAASCRTSSAAGTDAPLVAIQRAGERSVAETPDLLHAGAALLLWTGTYLVLAPGPRPCRTNLRSVSDGTPRSRATCAIGRPLSNTSRAPRSNSSGGHLRGRGIDGSSTSSRTDRPGFEVSVKPSLAQLGGAVRLAVA